MLGVSSMVVDTIDLLKPSMEAALPEVVPQLTSREGLVKRDRVLRDLDGVLTAAMQTVDGIDWQMASLQGHARPRWSLWR